MSTTTTAVIPAQRHRLTKAQQQAKIRLAAVRAAAELPPIDDDQRHGDWYYEQMNRLNGDD